MIKIAIADDHQLFIDGIESILKAYKEEITVVKTTNHGSGMLDILTKHEVHIAILDLTMPGMDKEDWIAAKDIRIQYPDVSILILTTHLNGKFIKELFDIGIKGYVVKEETQREIVDAIRKVYRGEIYRSKGVADAFFEESTKQENIEKLYLTDREKEIMVILFNDTPTAQEIADELFISKMTVNTHKKNIRKKLGVKSDKELMKYIHDHLLDELGLN